MKLWSGSQPTGPFIQSLSAIRSRVVRLACSSLLVLMLGPWRASCEGTYICTYTHTSQPAMIFHPQTSGLWQGDNPVEPSLPSTILAPRALLHRGLLQVRNIGAVNNSGRWSPLYSVPPLESEFPFPGNFRIHGHGVRHQLDGQRRRKVVVGVS